MQGHCCRDDVSVTCHISIPGRVFKAAQAARDPRISKFRTYLKVQGLLAASDRQGAGTFSQEAVTSCIPCYSGPAH